MRTQDLVDRRLVAVAPSAISGKPKTFRPGRVCDQPGCETVLSRYNAGALCWQHDPGGRFIVHRGGRPRRDPGPTFVELQT